MDWIDKAWPRHLKELQAEASNNLKDMLALGTSILRPEASKHRVCNSSRKQKLQVNLR